MSVCPPEKFVQQLIDEHRARSDPPDIHSPTIPPRHRPHHAPQHRTMPPATRNGMLKLVTFNILHAVAGHGDDWDEGEPPPRWISDIRKVIRWADPDFIGLQEAKVALSDITDAFTGPTADWQIFCDTGTPPEQQNPVLLRKGRWKDIESWTVLGCGPVGGSPARYISNVNATHVATGQRIRIINTHMNSNVDAGGVPSDTPRQDLYADHMEKVEEICGNVPERLLLFVMGDWNVDYDNPRGRRVRHWPMRALANEGMVANWFYLLGKPKMPHATHQGGRKVLDHIYHRRTPQVQFAATGVLTALGSDHFAVRATYRVTSLATGQDSRGRRNQGGSNSGNQGQRDDRSQRDNQQDNQPVDFDLIGTANLISTRTDHDERIEEILHDRGMAALCCQELTEAEFHSRWTTTQPNKSVGVPGGQALLRRDDRVTGGDGSVACSAIVEAGISKRFFVWGDVDLVTVRRKVRLVCVHMPPKRFTLALREDYAVTLRDLLNDSPHPWIAGGDWNLRLGLDPCDLRSKFNARWFGQGVNGFAVHPSLTRYVGGDGGRKFTVERIPYRGDEDHRCVRLRLAKIDTRQRNHEDDDTER